MDRICASTSAYLIADAIENDKPFSFIRYADGDAMFMNDEYHCDRILFNERLPEPFRSGYKERLFNAYNNADIIGIADPDEINKSIWYLQSYLMNGISPKGLISSSRDPIYWHDLDLYKLFIKKNVFIITSRDVKDRFYNRFGIMPNIITIGRPRRGANEHINEYLRFLSRPVEKGVYLIGWGIFAKAACDYLKQNGCVALDIGAIIDGWSGMQTRSYHKLKNYEI